MFLISIPQTKYHSYSPFSAIIEAILGQKTLHWQLNKVPPLHEQIQFWDNKLGFKKENAKTRKRIGVIHLSNYHLSDAFVKI